MDMRSLNSALDRFKDSFLVAAAKAGSEEEVVSLLDIGADVNWVSPDGEGDTALLAACRNGHRTVASMLLDQGANTKINARSGETPLHLACRRGDETLSKILLEHDVNASAVDADGRTAFDVARTKGFIELAAKLELMAIRGGMLPQHSSSAEISNTAFQQDFNDEDDEEDSVYEESDDELLDDLVSDEDILLAEARESALLDAQADALAAAARLHYNGLQEAGVGGQGITELASRLSQTRLENSTNREQEGEARGNNNEDEGNDASSLPPIGRWRGMTASFAQTGASIQEAPVSARRNNSSSTPTSGSSQQTHSPGGTLLEDPLINALQWTNNTSAQSPTPPVMSSLPALPTQGVDIRSTRPLSARPPTSARSTHSNPNSSARTLLVQNTSQVSSQSHNMPPENESNGGGVGRSPTEIELENKYVLDEDLGSDDGEDEADSFKMLSGREAEEFNRDLLDASLPLPDSKVEWSPEQTRVLQKLWKISRRELKSALAKAEATRAQSSRVWNELMASQAAEDRVRNENAKLQKDVKNWSGHAVKGATLEELEAMENQMKEALGRVTVEKERLIREKLFDEREQRVCVICQEAVKSVLLLPCRHLCLCGPCSLREELTSCPLCRADITDRITVYS